MPNTEIIKTSVIINFFKLLITPLSYKISSQNNLFLILFGSKLKWNLNIVLRYSIVNMNKLLQISFLLSMLFLTSFAYAHGMSEAEKQSILQGGNLHNI